MEANFYGIYGLLLKVSPGDLALFLLTTLNIIIPGGRFIEDGFCYNTSLAAQFGDNALIIAIWSACRVLQETKVVSEELNNVQGQVLIAIGSFLIGLVLVVLAFKMRGGLGKIVDLIHNIAIVPLFVFLAVTIFPVAFRWDNWKQACLIIILIVMWLGLSYYDAKAGRLDQPEYLKQRGVNLPLKKIIHAETGRSGP